MLFILNLGPYCVNTQNTFSKGIIHDHHTTLIILCLYLRHHTLFLHYKLYLNRLCNKLIDSLFHSSVSNNSTHDLAISLFLFCFK